MDIHGIGPAGAARILADVGDVARFPDRNHFASPAGTAPIDASSGEHTRHRLSRAGNRRLNHVLYMAGIAGFATTPPAGPTTGASSPAGRPRWRPCAACAGACRRGLPPARRRRRHPGTRNRKSRPGRALEDDSKIQRGRPDPGHRLFGQATSRTRTLDATPGPCPPGTPRAGNSRHTAATRRRVEVSAPHRTNDIDADKRRRTLEGLPDPRPLTSSFIEGSQKRTRVQT
jgi:hypothetical protein